MEWIFPENEIERIVFISIRNNSISLSANYRSKYSWKFDIADKRKTKPTNTKKDWVRRSSKTGNKVNHLNLNYSELEVSKSETKKKCIETGKQRMATAVAEKKNSQCGWMDEWMEWYNV